MIAAALASLVAATGLAAAAYMVRVNVRERADIVQWALVGLVLCTSLASTGLAAGYPMVAL